MPSFPSNLSTTVGLDQFGLICLDTRFINITQLGAGAESVSLVQDASMGWLCLRFGSNDQSLQQRRGFLGVFNLASLGQSHAMKVREATVKIVEQFLEPKVTMPFSKVLRFLDLLLIIGK